MDYLNEIINKFSSINISLEWIAIGISCILVILGVWRLIAQIKANAISKHPKQLEVYNAFGELAFYVNTNGLGLDMHEIAKFNQVLKKSDFYFDKKFAIQLNEYFDICWDLADLNRKSLRDQKDDKKMGQIEKEQDILFDKEIQLSKEIEENFKSILKI